MSDAIVWIERNFLWLWLGGAAWTALLLAVSALTRRRRGQPLLRPEIAGAVFLETWTSGGRSVLGWAHNCLWVAVTPTELHIGLHFPFSLLGGCRDPSGQGCSFPSFAFRYRASSPLESAASFNGGFSRSHTGRIMERRDRFSWC